MSKQPEESEERPEDNSQADLEKMERELWISPMDEDSIQMFEMYRSLLRAGFRERQALTLVATIINEAQMSEIYYVRDDDDPEEDQKDGQ